MSKGERGQRIEPSMLWEGQSLYPSCLGYDSIVLWWRQESKFRGGGQWVCLWNMLVSSFLCFCYCGPESRFNGGIVGLPCALFCSKLSQVLLVLILLEKQNVQEAADYSVGYQSLSLYLILMILLEVSKPYWPCTRLEGTVERV